MAASHSIRSTTIELSPRFSVINLSSIYEKQDRHRVLYNLLKERDAVTNISHRKLPSWDEHVQFVESHPYKAWYFIQGATEEIIGSCYLSHQNEIGVFIFKSRQGKGDGQATIKALMNAHGPGRYLANINPHNERSLGVFAKLGFKKIQETYELNID